MSTERIIVLAAGALERDGTFANFKDGMYLGGQVRFEAAAQIAHDRPEAELTLVGGYNKTTEGDPQFSTKVNDMATFISGRCATANLRLIYSLPCTHHNFVAAFNNWTAAGIEVDEVSILTNGYHMKRAKAFAMRAATSFEQYAHVQFASLPAEEILGNSVESIVSGRRDEYLARLESEERGLEQLYSGTYEDNCLTRNTELLRPVLTRYSAVLLTKDELARFALQPLS